jgi:putative transposase
MATAVLACDFFVTVTASFRVLYFFIVLDVGTRLIVHWRVTKNPTVAWMTQQFRTTIIGEHAHRYLGRTDEPGMRLNGNLLNGITPVRACHQ